MGIKDLRRQLSQSSGSPQQSVPTPGKQALPQEQAGSNGPYKGSAFSQGLEAPTVQHDTGNDLVDQGLGCEGASPGTSGCVLSPQQRARLLPTYQSRVTAAQQQYVAALIELRIEELLKKEPEASEWMLEMMLEIIGHVVITGAMKALQALKGGATEAIDQAIQDGSALSSALREESSDHLSTAISMAVGLGKKQTTAALEHKADPTRPEAGKPKAANVAFLDYLKDQSATIYENLREGAIAGLSDSTFLVLFESFRASNGHTVGVYKEALKGKLDRFKKSEVGQIGVTDNESALSNGPWRWDTRAFWVQTPLGRRLGLYRRDYQEIPDTVSEYGGPSRAASPIDKAMMAVEDAKRPFAFWRYVPVEFEGAAVAMHVARWKTDPIVRVAQTPEEITFAGVTL